MISPLTTRERDILQLLLRQTAPVTTSEIAARMHLSPRQVRYSLKGVRNWIDTQEDCELRVIPSVGVQLIGSKPVFNELGKDLKVQKSIRLILGAVHRQQLLAIFLLLSLEPVILSQLQQLFEISRTTIIKDLKVIEPWVNKWKIRLESRPNYGYALVSDERLRRQALAALLWGESEFDSRIAELSYNGTLQFTLSDDHEMLPGVQIATRWINQLDIPRSLRLVAEAEAKLSGRLNDDAVRYLALNFAIQTLRVKEGNTLEEQESTITQLKGLPIWSIARHVLARMGLPLQEVWSKHEVANIGVQLLTSSRNDCWPPDLDIDPTLNELIEFLMVFIAEAYQIPKLENDTTLRDGLAVHIIPACLRAQFGYETPPYFQKEILIANKYQFEQKIARNILLEIKKFTGIDLPQNEIGDISLLLRAAYIRERPNHLERVFVVCPSGMAVAQLLVARLKARFPRLGSMEVISMRLLTPERIKSAQLLITTVPLPEEIYKQIDVIQVHPLLMPEDVEKITEFMA